MTARTVPPFRPHRRERLQARRDMRTTTSPPRSRARMRPSSAVQLGFSRDPRRAKAAPMKSDDPRQRLLGTWKLIAAVREEIPSGTKTDFLGSSPTGYINYAPDGRMMVLNVGNGRRKPVGANATPAEAEALFRSMTSYGGTYTIDGNEITHHVDVSWNETWTGTKQKRIARFEGNRVYLSTSPSPDPLTGTISTRTMTWEKVT
jgi:hypothetical protein